MLTSLRNQPRDYAWGSTTLLADFESRTPTGEPEAEVWFGDHPSSPARVASGEFLPEVLASAGQPPLPYLLKLLAAGSPLSIQVHPSKRQAEAGFEAEAHLLSSSAKRNYHDANHKPEIIVALSPTFEAFGGLRDRDASIRLLQSFPPSAPLDTLIAKLQEGEPADALRNVIEWLLSGQAADVVQAASAAVQHVREGEFAPTCAAVARAAGHYEGDPGIVVVLLMNFVTLRRGEGLFLRAGMLHTYQAGLGVELMAASDNVLRGGLTPKRIDVAELMHLVDTTPSELEVLHPRVVAGIAGMGTYGPGVPDFALATVRPTDAGTRYDSPGPTMILATQGVVTVSADGETLELGVGECAMRFAGSGPISISGDGEAFVATPGTELPVPCDTP